MRTSSTRSFAAWFVAVTLSACSGGGSVVVSDAGSTGEEAGRGDDASHRDARADAQRPDASASTPDAAAEADAFAPEASTDGAIEADAMTAPADAHEAGKSDAHDAGEGGVSAALAPAAPCTGTASQVYGTVTGLPPMTEALRGDIVACTDDGALTVSDVQSDLTAQGDTGVTAVTGVSVYRVQYRTTRASGAAGYSSARIYLPANAISSQPPVIVAAHGTEGLASACATSMNSTSMRDLALPWAALGYPVIAPDYAGLGTPGTQGYTDNHDTARSVVDSVEALRKFVGATLAPSVVIDGHSQGGGAALATQALAKSMNLDGELVAVLAFAPEYFSHLDSLGYIGALKAAAATDPLTISTGVTKCEVATLIEYAYFANYVSSGPPTAGFPAAQAGSLQNAVESLCTVELGGAIQADAVHVAEWTDPTLRDELLQCVPGYSGPNDAGATCTGAGLAFYDYLQQNIVSPDPAGAPVLLVQGLEDQVMPPDQEAACNVIALEAGGVTPQVCTDATASHTTVVQRNIAFGIQWAQAVLAHTSLPACAASDLPACSAP